MTRTFKEWFEYVKALPAGTEYIVLTPEEIEDIHSLHVRPRTTDPSDPLVQLERFWDQQPTLLGIPIYTEEQVRGW